jgi:hypothetical protein
MKKFLINIVTPEGKIVRERIIMQSDGKKSIAEMNKILLGGDCLTDSTTKGNQIQVIKIID